MAIIIYGKSTCKMCGDLIYENQKIISFYGLVHGENDPLYFFYDRAFHQDCFLRHPLKEDVVERLIKKGKIKSIDDILMSDC